MSQERIPREISDELRELLASIGGVGNRRYTHAVAMALQSPPVREAVEIAIDVCLSTLGATAPQRKGEP